MDRKFYEDCSYWNPFWGSTPGLPTSNIHDLAAHFQEQIAPTSVGKGKNKPDLYFADGFVVANGWIVQNPLFSHKPALLRSIVSGDPHRR